MKVAENDNVVFAARIDRSVSHGHRIELPVAGMFELSDGEITACP